MMQEFSAMYDENGNGPIEPQILEEELIDN